jgi:drug/metabolite transporter (DMT)-like permease
MINKVLFWALLAMIGALIIGFGIGGQSGGKWAAMWMVFIAIIGTVYIIIYQRRNQ